MFYVQFATLYVLSTGFFFFLPLALWAASKLCSNGLLPEQGQSQPCLGQPVPTPILLLKKACVARQVCSALSIFVASNWISVFNYLESVCIKSAQLTKVMNRDGKFVCSLWNLTKLGGHAFPLISLCLSICFHDY